MHCRFEMKFGSTLSANGTRVTLQPRPWEAPIMLALIVIKHCAKVFDL